MALSVTLQGMGAFSATIGQSEYTFEVAFAPSTFSLTAEIATPGPKGDKGDPGAPGGVGPVGPKGDKGDTGSPGAAATIAVGTTSTLAPGSSATVANVGTSSAAVFDFGIPQGAKGDKGEKGDTGATGPSGVVSATAPLSYDSGTKNLSIDLSAYATQSYVTSQGYITSSALTPYLTISSASSTYQTQAGMSAYLTTSAASSIYLTQANAASTYYLASNPSGYITSSALSPYLLSSAAASTYFAIPTGTTAQYLRGNGTLSTFSTDVIAAVPSASTSTAGKVQLATVAEAIAGTDTAKATTSEDLAKSIRSRLLTRRVVHLASGTALGTQTTGTGWGYTQLQTYCNVVAAANTVGFTRAYGVVVPTNPKYFSVANNYFNNAGGMAYGFQVPKTVLSYYNGLVIIMRAGEANGPTAGTALPANPTNKRIGWKYIVGSTVKLQVHNGTTYKETDTGWSPVNSGDYAYFETLWDGLGNATLNIYTAQGTIVTTTTDGAPTGGAESAVNGSICIQLSGDGTNTLGYNLNSSNPSYSWDW